MNTMKNLFPQDTRASEILSALSFLFLSLFFQAGVIDKSVYNFIAIHGVQFWVVILFCFGSLQFFSIVLFPKAEVLRVLMSWINGSLWIWISLQATLDVSDVCAFFFGIGNLYAFCVNSLMLKKQWVI